MRGEDNAPQKLVFYESRRQKVRDGLLDFVAISKIKETKLNCWDYSEVAIGYACYMDTLAINCLTRTTSKAVQMVTPDMANKDSILSR
jgi:hypothetical protein